MTIPHLPVLRHGVPYQSLDTVTLVSVRTGEPVAAVSHANAGMIRRDMRRMEAARAALRAVPVEELLRISARAGELFLHEDLPVPGGSSQSPQAYVECLSATTGLPHALVRRNMAKIHQVFTEMRTILAGLTRGLPIEVLDRGSGEQDGIPVSYCAAADSLAVVLPSNSPGVNTLWMPAIALKIPVALKPGREEPWTPLRIIQAFLAAGCPQEAFSFYPAGHDGSAALIESARRALLFGDENTVLRYAGDQRVQVHGPGRSKILIGADAADRWPDFVDLIVQSIAENGGRSCINASAILVPSHARELGEAVAERLVEIVPRAADDPAAQLAGFANAAVADFIDQTIDQDLRQPGAEDLTARLRSAPRRVELDGCAYLLPTLVHCASFDHPLSNREFLFPYASIVEVPQERMLDAIGPSLVVTAITRDARFQEQLVASPSIDRLNLGPIPTTRVEWNQPHEGNLFEFLYRRRTIQRAEW